MGFVLGQRVADYKVEGVLGSGGMGRVYRVSNVISGRTEAMKVLLANLSAETALAARFRGEIQILAGLRHPNIAQLHTALTHGNELLMTMEFVEGLTLHQLAQKGPCSPEAAAGYIQQVLTALSYAHGRGVIHRDIKPANIMVAPQGVVKLMDFGIAKSKTKEGATSPGATLGSLNYISPEQALDSGAVDERSDIYSVGITLYELLTGKLPFDDESAYVVLRRQIKKSPRPPIEMNPRLPKALSDLIMKALEKDPAQRFQSAGEFSDQLGEVTGVAASEAVLVAGGFSEVSSSAPGAGGVWVAPTAAHPVFSQTSNKRHRRSMAAAVVAIVAVVAFGASEASHRMKGGFTTTNGPSSTAQLSQSPTDPADTFAATDPQPILTDTPAKATVIAKSETVVDSSRPSAGNITQSLKSTAASATPRLSRAHYHAAALPEGPPEAEDLAATHAAEPVIVGDAKAEPSARPLSSAAMTAELQEIRRQKAALEARATAIRSQMMRLRSQKIAEGHEVSESMADAYVDMNESLNAGILDVESGDAAAGRKNIEKAAYAVNVLEKMFSQNP